jgi:nucleoside-diphosphate-sugar epimerase
LIARALHFDVIVDVPDTNRGFKAFNRKLLTQILPVSIVNGRPNFDPDFDYHLSGEVEWLTRARIFGYTISPASILWIDNPEGSTMGAFWNSALLRGFEKRMLKGLWRQRSYHAELKRKFTYTLANSRVGITGASGSIGNFLAGYWSQQPKNVKVGTISRHGLYDRIEILKFASKNDVIFHLAGESNPAGVAQTDKLSQALLADGISTALVAVASRGKRLVVASSSAVYKNDPDFSQTYVPSEDRLNSLQDASLDDYVATAVREFTTYAESYLKGEDRRTPEEFAAAFNERVKFPTGSVRNVYGLVKLIRERVALAANPDTVILRLWNVYGQPHDRDGRIIPDVIQQVSQAKLGWKPAINDDRSMAYVDISTVTRAFEAAAVYPVVGAKRRIFNVAGPELISGKEIVHAVVTAFGFAGYDETTDFQTKAGQTPVEVPAYSSERLRRGWWR